MQNDKILFWVAFRLAPIFDKHFNEPTQKIYARLTRGREAVCVLYRVNLNMLRETAQTILVP